jgi:hypothetical protein
VYRRVDQALDAGAKILLLTATPYGTNPQNISSLLRLLPATSPHGLGVPVRWEASGIDEFVKLPITTILGFPHVLGLARQRGDVDHNHRTFIVYGGERRYLPRLLKLR